MPRSHSAFIARSHTRPGESLKCRKCPPQRSLTFMAMRGRLAALAFAWWHLFKVPVMGGDILHLNLNQSPEGEDLDLCHWLAGVPSSHPNLRLYQ